MSTEYVQKKNDSNYLLKFDSQYGPISEVSADPRVNQPRKKAVYVSYEGGFIGVIGRDSGPVLFINGRMFPFTDSSWSVAVNKHATHNECVISQHGQEVFRKVYQKPSLDELDPWSDEESEDFYAWLAAKRYDAEFSEMWTVG